MKKALYFIGIAATLAACSPKESNAYTICGVLPEDCDAEMMYLISGSDVIDSAAVADKAFKFAGTINPEIGSQVTLLDNASPREAKIGTSLFYEPGTATVSFDEDKRIKVSGTPANDAKNAFNEKVAALDDEDEDGYYQAIIDAAKANTGNAFGLDQLYMATIYKIMEGQEVLDVLNSFPEALKSSKKGEATAKAAEAAIKTANGQPFIDFALASITDGQPLSLKSVVEKEGNKYVLLDFWASWCGPCMREVPFLIETYQKFHSKGFEIFGCSLDRTEEPWKKAVEEKGMNWVHVSDIKYWDCEGAALYGVRSIPANFLIDCSTGTIIASGLRGNALLEKIAELVD